MLLNLTRGYVPESYSESKDYQVFLKELEILLNIFKYDINQFPSLYDADNCPEHMLPLLATMVGYSYKESRSIKSNRKIIKEFPYLIRNRGSALGLKSAVILCINTSPGITHYYTEDSIILDIDTENGIIQVFYPQEDVIDWDLIEVVRPVGMQIKLMPSKILDNTDTIEVRTGVSSRKTGDSSTVDESIVGYNILSNEQGGDMPNE